MSPSMVTGTVIVGGAPTSVAEGAAAPVGDGVLPLGLVPVAEGLAITVGLDAPGAVGLAGGAGILVTIGEAVSVGVTIGEAVSVGVGDWGLSRTTIVPVTLLTLFMW